MGPTLDTQSLTSRQVTAASTHLPRISIPLPLVPALQLHNLRTSHNALPFHLVLLVNTSPNPLPSKLLNPIAHLTYLNFNFASTSTHSWDNTLKHKHHRFEDKQLDSVPSSFPTTITSIASHSRNRPISSSYKYDYPISSSQKYNVNRSNMSHNQHRHDK